MNKDITPEEQENISQAWKAFALEVIKSEKSAAEKGCRWLYAISHVLDKTPAEIQKKLPDKHPLKLSKTDTESLEKSDKINKRKISTEAVKKQFVKTTLTSTAKKLKKALGNPEKISKIDFYGVTFENDVNFSNFIFPVDVSFEKSKFLTAVRFDNVIFFDTADFEGAEFHTKTSSHLESARFRNTTFKKIANFRNATFWRYANFKGAFFSGRTTFQKATFKCNAPRFYYATFNYEMTFLGMIPSKFWYSPYEKSNERLEEITKIWRKQGLWGIWQIWTTWRIWDIKVIWTDRQVRREKYKSRIQENQNSYENTSILLEKQGKYHDRHFFFRQEMCCRRRLEGPFNFTTYGIYQLFANYGYGVGRALLGWFLHICAWAGVLMLFNYQPVYMVKNPFWCSFFTSLSNAHSFFLSKKERLRSCNIKDTVTEKSTFAFDVIWAMETISGAFFLFLLLLTLRVRFRLNNQ